MSADQCVRLMANFAASRLKAQSKLRTAGHAQDSFDMASSNAKLARSVCDSVVGVPGNMRNGQRLHRQLVPA